MPAFGRWVHSTFGDSAIINEKCISEMPSLPSLRAYVTGCTSAAPWPSHTSQAVDGTTAQGQGKSALPGSVAFQAQLCKST